jgi:hypothetical protein
LEWGEGWACDKTIPVDPVPDVKDYNDELFCLPPPSAPQAVTNLHIESSRLTTNSNNLTVNFSWTGPSTRNGSYNYNVTYSGEQVDDYPEGRRRNHPNTIVVLDGSNTSLPIIGLPYANYTINVTTFNIKTRRPGPSAIQSARSINIGI